MELSNCPKKINLLSPMSLLEKIKEIANNVYSTLGKGFSENIYQEAMKIDLMKNNLIYQSELIVPVYYNNFIIGNVRADIVVEKKNNYRIKSSMF